MERPRLAATLGAVTCLLTVVAVVAPYVATDASVVSLYYGVGAVSPLAVALLGMVGVVAFAAGANGRSDPGLVAGLMLVAGAVSLLVAVQWALSFGGLRADVASSAARQFLSRHRWSVVAGTAVWTVVAGWYAATLGLLGVAEAS